MQARKTKLATDRIDKNIEVIRKNIEVEQKHLTEVKNLLAQEQASDMKSSFWIEKYTKDVRDLQGAIDTKKATIKSLQVDRGKMKEKFDELGHETATLKTELPDDQAAKESVQAAKKLADDQAAKKLADEKAAKEVADNVAPQKKTPPLPEWIVKKQLLSGH